jgi:hypothetical protein
MQILVHEFGPLDIWVWIWVFSDSVFRSVFIPKVTWAFVLYLPRQHVCSEI